MRGQVWKGKQVYPYESTSVARPRHPVDGRRSESKARFALNRQTTRSILAKVAVLESLERRARDAGKREGARALCTTSRQGTPEVRSHWYRLPQPKGAGGLWPPKPAQSACASCHAKRFYRSCHGKKTWHLSLGIWQRELPARSRNRRRTMMPRSAASAARVGSPRSEDRRGAKEPGAPGEQAEDRKSVV